MATDAVDFVALERIGKLIARCENAPANVLDVVLGEVTDFLNPSGHERIDYLIGVGAYLDAAAAMLPEGAVWRVYTDRCATVYGASPYKADAQERFDGYSDERPLAICAAYLRMLEAPLKRDAIRAAKSPSTQPVSRGA